MFLRNSSLERMISMDGVSVRLISTLLEKRKKTKIKGYNSRF